VKAEWEVVAPRVDAAVLWPKRFEVTAAAYLEPLRVQYYVHHPRGRAHAELVGVAVPQFYANVDVPEPEPAQVRARVRTHLWVEPVVVVKAQARPVWVHAPRPGWRAKVKVKAAPPRARVAWYVRPADVRTRFVYGADVKAKWAPRVKVNPPAARADLRAKLRVRMPDVGVRIKIGPPNLDAAAKARMKVKIGPNGVLVRDHRAASGGISGAAAAGADVKGGMDAKVKGGMDVKVKVPDVKGGVDVKVRDHRDDVKGKVDGAAGAGADVKVKVRDHRDDVKAKVDGAAGAGADVKAKVKVQAPKVKVTPPKVKVKVKGEASGGFKIGK
jgi:hypothetical protein